MSTAHFLNLSGPLAFVSGALRNSGAGWGTIDDDAHFPSSIDAVIEHSNHIEIRHAVGATAVSSFQIQPDEWFAARALRVGASVGLDLTRIFLYSGSSTVPVNPATLIAPSGNLWVTGFLWV